MKILGAFCLISIGLCVANVFAQVRSSVTYVGASSSDSTATQGNQQRKRYTAQESREVIRVENRAYTTRLRARLDDNIKIASDRNNEMWKRQAALMDVGRSLDLRAARELLKFYDSPEKPMADKALVALSRLAYGLRMSEDAAQLAEFKKIVAPKMRSIAKEESLGLDRLSSVASIMNDIGDDAEAVRLGKMLLHKGRHKIINLFWYHDQSVSPAAFRIKPLAKQLFLDSVSDKQPENVRMDAAALLAQAGEVDIALPVFSEILLAGKDMQLRYRAMTELYSIGDGRAKEVVRKAIVIPELSKSAENRLMSWDKRPTK